MRVPRWDNFRRYTVGSQRNTAGQNRLEFAARGLTDGPRMSPTSHVNVTRPRRRVMRLLRMLPWMLAAVSCSSPAAKQTPAAALGVTVFEGGRLITGDGSAPIES